MRHTSARDSSTITPVQSLIRGLAVIQTFGAERPRQTLTQVAEATGLARATARRFLHTLVQLGFAATDGHEFWLTPRILSLGTAYLSGLGLPALAQPRLEQLSRQLNESVSMAVLDNTDVVYVNRVAVRRIMTVGITIGSRFPAYATSMGRVLLADLSDKELKEHLDQVDITKIAPNTLTDSKTIMKRIREVKNQGWCIVDQELEAGLRSLAAPVRNAEGRVVAAINTSTQTAVHDLATLHEKFLPALLETAHAISEDLTATGKDYHDVNSCR
ncbi:helix-turn-helix domain-containing protein [Corynebacterium poyangense]|uniref:Helix-turn-helix domain-containing protein n=1 Tax=Corynebacterium poyangense TaxID=2684405 RepID=A0A7H0SQI2_9CORY|nr:IclR family transcriptional regulator C-terminal domain-containing protein [Corynebacterium poyangense]MBZ8178304.1 helix-turn-helix domain-containing protein [Corynebacterium poyangense]QNQ90807.1 helix-turn-helix domain-containing protein [Corynebacterium poyangense]